MDKEISIKTIDDFSIFGRHLYSGSKDIILWCHGITVDGNEYLNFFKDGAELLFQNGVDSLRIDFRGHGRSSGKTTDFCITGQLLDIDACINYISSMYKNVKVHFVGCSFGSAPGILKSFERNNLFSSIVLIAPVLSYSRTFISPESEWAMSIFNEETVKRLNESNELYINKDFCISSKLYKEMLYIEPSIFIDKINQEVIIVHGEQDSMVPYKISDDISRKHKNIILVSMKDMDHGFMDIEDEIGDSTKSIDNKNNIYNIISQAIKKTNE